MARRAIISVTDKDNLDVLVEGLSRHDYEIVSTGGTAKRIREIVSEKGYDIKVLDASEVTGFPEMMDGRVKTLHPKIHGGILCDRDNGKHMGEAEKNGVELIDLVVVNLYEFEKTAAEEGATEEDIIEAIDIGGPTMMISGIKNCKHVGVLADPSAYEAFVKELDENDGESTVETRRRLAAFAINMIADYRGAIGVELTRRFTGEETLRRKFVQGQQLGRYGENWAQKAWKFILPGVTEANVFTAEQVHGGPMGYNNYVDAAGALETIKEFAEGPPAAVVVKHTNPCGVATADTLENALERGWQGDSVSAFGSILAFNREVDLATMKVICDRMNNDGRKGWFVEVMIAPSYSKEALEYVKGLKTKEGLRLLATGDLNQGEKEEFVYREELGGLLKQTRDDNLYLVDSVDELFKAPYEMTCPNSGKKLTVGIVTTKKPDGSKKGLYEFAMKAAKHTKSNAIVICREYAPGKYQVLGMGAGQPNRKDSGGKLAITKATENLETEHMIILGKAKLAAEAVLASEYSKLMKTELGGMTKEDYVRDQLENHCCLASDAMFPYRDGIDAIAKLGVKNVIQPGGANKDPDVIKAANGYGMAMVHTGARHFLH
jgi:phosphoribosylaminoimidazolecarboxamide formyltransferase/IMP cyclohydrolase